MSPSPSAFEHAIGRILPSKLTPRSTEPRTKSRPRSVTDLASGKAPQRADFPNHTEEELAAHFNTFTQFDIDSNGFITPENLLDVLTAMKIDGASMDMVNLIIAEVAVITGHENDGKLSFRDYMQCVALDSEAAAHNLAVDAQAELLVSVEEEEEHSLRMSARQEEEEESSMPDVSDTAPAAPAASVARTSFVASDTAGRGRMRQSSMAAVNAVATARIRAFQQAADANVAADKLAAFRSTPRGLTPLSGPIVNSEEIHKATLKNKVAAFETASRFKGTLELKKTWRQVGESRNYREGKKIVAYDGAPVAPPPKRALRDLP